MGADTRHLAKYKDVDLFYRIVDEYVKDGRDRKKVDYYCQQNDISFRVFSYLCNYKPELKKFWLEAKQRLLKDDEVLFTTILAKYDNGDTLAKAVEDSGGSIHSFNRMKRNNDLFSAQWQAARADRCDTLTEQLIEIADNEKINPHQARNMIGARQWIASKLKPALYGERIDLRVESTVNVSTALSEALGRAKLRIGDDSQDDNVVDAEYTDITDTCKELTSDGVSDKPPTNDDSDDDIFS